MTPTKTFLAALSLAVLAGCGGGSSSPPAVYPLDSSQSAFYAMANSYTLHATSGGNSYALHLQFVPGGMATFNGVTVLSFSLPETLSENGTVIGTSSQTDYYLGGPFTQVGAVFSTGQAIVDDNQKLLPALAKPGQSGSLDTQTYYSDISFTNVIATGARTWKLTELTADTAQFCIHDTDNLGGSPETEDDCETLDTSGNVLAFQITTTVNGTLLTFQ